MKKVLIIISLAALLITPLIMAGCGCGGGGLSDADIAVIKADHTKVEGFGKRLDDHDSDIGKIQGTLESLDTETLAKLAELDADKLVALLNLDLSTALTDIENLQDDIDDINDSTKAGSLADVVVRLEDLENGQSGGNGDGGSNPDGEVVVEIDVAEPPYTFTTGGTAAAMVVPVKITNGTDGYYEVMFNVTLRCVTSDYEAEVTGVPTMDVNGVGMMATPVSSWAECRYIYFVWVSSEPILVAPDKTFTVYLYLYDFTTAANEVWEASLSDTTATEL